jgi:hypothetical protein
MAYVSIRQRHTSAYLDVRELFPLRLVDAELVEQKARKSEPYRIVIGEHRIIRETDE